MVPRPLTRVVAHPRALAVAVLRDDEEVRLVVGDVDLDHLVVSAQLHAGDTGRVAAHRTHLLAVEANRLAHPRHHQHVVAFAREPHADELVVLAELDRDDPVGLERRVVRGELRLLDHPLPRREHEVLRLREVARGDDRLHVLVLPERQQVHDRSALRLPRAERELVHLEPVHLSHGREEQDVVVGGRDEQMLDVVLVLQVHPHHADAASPLLAVGRHR